MKLERELDRPLWYLLPGGLLLAAVTLFPLGHVLWLSLQRRSPLSGPPRIAIKRNLIADALRVGQFVGRIHGRSVKVEREQ